MDEHLFLMGQRVLTPEGKGEVADAIGDKIVVKLDDGSTQTFPSDDLQDDSNGGRLKRFLNYGNNANISLIENSAPHTNSSAAP